MWGRRGDCGGRGRKEKIKKVVDEMRYEMEAHTLTEPAAATGRLSSRDAYLLVDCLWEETKRAGRNVSERRKATVSKQTWIR